MRKPTPPRSIRNVAMDLLSRREHSLQELRQKLKLRGHEGDDVEVALEKLVVDRLQSDDRFTESYVHHRVNAGLGPMKIRYELREKGVDDVLADLYLQPMEGQWNEIMKQQRIRKFGEEIPNDYKLQMKQARFLQNRGFSPESVMRLFR
ncbi:MAG: regulatory protein [Planctomycetota bacterium]|jgi:regulatory protein